MPKTLCSGAERYSTGYGKEKRFSGLDVNCGVAHTSFNVIGAAPVFIFSPLSVVCY